MRQKGFTLVEVLIAMAIVSVISLIAYDTLKTTLKHQSIQKQHSQILNKLQKTLIYFDRDLSQIFNQEITLNKNSIQLTSVQNDNLTNIRYVFETNIIKRQDPTNKEKFGELILLKGVEKFEIRVLDNNNRWHNTWQYKNNKNHLKAIEIKFTHHSWGEIKQLILI